MKSRHHWLISITILLLGLVISNAALAQKIQVTAANPASGSQGTSDDLLVEISGNGFANDIDEVIFLLPCETEGCEDDTGGIAVGIWTVKSNKKITVPINLLTAKVSDFDIRVSSSTRGRGGKGTTYRGLKLFKVNASGSSQPSDCMLDFEAYFADADGDGVRSDGGGSYVAFGGKGMRLDTNGSQKLERKNDTRFVRIDFSANGYCSPNNPLPDDPENPAGATGFCSETKGVDMRIEHQVQEPQGLCSIEPYEVDLPVEDYSMLQTVRISFEGGPDSTPLLEELVLNGNGGSTVPAAFKLNYGCQGPRIDPAVSANHAADRVLITRLDEYTWLFEGEYACVTSQLGNIMVDEGENPIRVRMPFALCIEDINGPMDQCNSYFPD